MDKIVEISICRRTECENFVPGEKIIDVSNMPWEKLPVMVPAELSLTTKQEDNVLLYTYKLSFKSMAAYISRPIYVYKVKTTSGGCYLLGGRYRPFPMPTVKKIFPADATSEVYTTEVSWVSTHKMQPVTG